jgi:hypothetical protein
MRLALKARRRQNYKNSTMDRFFYLRPVKILLTRLFSGKFGARENRIAACATENQKLRLALKARTDVLAGRAKTEYNRECG